MLTPEFCLFFSCIVLLDSPSIAASHHWICCFAYPRGVSVVIAATHFSMSPVGIMLALIVASFTRSLYHSRFFFLTIFSILLSILSCSSFASSIITYGSKRLSLSYHFSSLYPTFACLFIYLHSLSPHLSSALFGFSIATGDFHCVFHLDFTRFLASLLLRDTRVCVRLSFCAIAGRTMYIRVMFG